MRMTAKQVRRHDNKSLRYVGIDPRKLTDAERREAIRLIFMSIETTGREHKAAVRGIAAIIAAQQ
jgi:hypothetical protein